MATVKQPSARPTNKLTAATVAALIMGWIGLAVQNFLPGWYDPAVWANTMPFAILVVGWFVKDKANA